MPVRADDHGCFLDLFGIMRLNKINHIEAPQGCIAVLPHNPRALTSDFRSHRLGQFLELLGISKCFRRKPTQNHIRCHVAPPCRSCCLSGSTGAVNFAKVRSCCHSPSRHEQMCEKTAPYRTRAAVSKSETASTRLAFLEPFTVVWYPDVMLISLAASFPAKLPSAPGTLGSSTWSTSDSV